MAGIRGRNTRPELAIRHALHRRGLRYRLHPANVPGKPDLAFPARKAVIFINGCFWHGHDCPFFRLPQTRSDFWRAKIDANKTRDLTVRRELERLSWRHLTIWECSMRGKPAGAVEAIADAVGVWLCGRLKATEIRGT